MEQKIFKIKKAFLVPFITMVVLLFVLTILAFWNGQPWEKTVLVFSCAGALIVGIEAAKREIVITQDVLSIRKFFRKKDIRWSDMTQLAVVALNKKVYFLLTTTGGFYFFSNMYENHSLLIRSIVDRLDIERVEVEVKNYLEHPLERRSLIVICWITVLIVAAFIFLKLFSG